MSEKNSSTDIFSLDRKPRASYSYVEPSQEQYLPYAQAWKEFDKLQKRARAGGPFRPVVAVIEYLAMMGVTFGFFRTARRNVPALAIVWGASVIIGLFLKQRASNKFAHWPCPRCHSEWPGTKLEKDPACGACGLRLHQFSP